MTTKEAKENIIKNFRANYTTENNPSVHDIEVFLLNTMENLEIVIKSNFKKSLVDKLKYYEGRYGCENTRHEIITIIKNNT